MPGTARKRKKRSFKFLIIFIFTLFIFSTGYLYFKFFKKTEIISPIPELSQKSKTIKENEDRKNKFQEALTKNKIDFSAISQSSDGSILVELKDGAKINFDQNKNINEQISSLQLMLSRFTIEGKRIDNLDFRYDNPVILFKK